MHISVKSKWQRCQIYFIMEDFKMRIATNITAMNTYRNYSINNSNVAKAAEKLSSGYAINSASDDAAGLAITEKMKAQINGLNTASKNSQDAISLCQTAEGALSSTQDMLQTMNELAVQSANGTNENFDRSAISSEFDQLKTEIDQTASTTTYNNMNILDGSIGAAPVTIDAASTLNTGVSLSGTDGDYSVYANSGMSASKAGTFALSLGTVNAATGKFTAGGGSTALQISFTDATTGDKTNTVLTTASVIQGTVGNGSSFTLDLNQAGLGTYSIAASADSAGSGTSSKADFITTLDGLNVVTQAGAGTGGAMKVQVGAIQGEQMDISIGNMDSTSLGVNAASISTQDGASAAITATRAAINTVSNQRATLGAYENRLNYKIDNLSAQSQNLSSAESQIKDVDIAKEMTEYTKDNILSQAATAMLAQANSAPQNVLSLMK